MRNEMRVEGLRSTSLKFQEFLPGNHNVARQVQVEKKYLVFLIQGDLANSLNTSSVPQEGVQIDPTNRFPFLFNKVINLSCHWIQVYSDSVSKKLPP